MSAGVNTGNRSGIEIREANLIPATKGEVRNPLGVNGSTYKRNFEQTIERILKGDAVDETLLAIVPEKVRTILELLPEGTTAGEAIAFMTVMDGMTGERTEILKRLWPAPKQGDDPVDSHTILIVKDFSGGRDGSAPHEIGSNEVKQVSSGEDTDED